MSNVRERYTHEGCVRLLAAIIRRAWNDRTDPLRRHEAETFLISDAVAEIAEEFGLSREAIRTQVMAQF